jgi:hypothetical protein
MSAARRSSREHPRCAGEHELTPHDAFRSPSRLDAVTFLADLHPVRAITARPSTDLAGGTLVVPFGARCVSHFTSWYLRRESLRFLSEASVARVALGSFWQRTSVRCQRASHAGSCRDPTQAAQPSHRYSSAALLGTLALRLRAHETTYHIPIHFLLQLFTLSNHLL